MFVMLRFVGEDEMGDGGSGIWSVGNATFHVIASNDDVCRRSGFCVMRWQLKVNLRTVPVEEEHPWDVVPFFVAICCINESCRDLTNSSDSWKALNDIFRYYSI